MNYIGSKKKLLGFIESSINNIVTEDLRDSSFYDLFGGTSVVSEYMNQKVKNICINDLELYSYYISYAKFNIRLNSSILNHIDYINSYTPSYNDRGFIFDNYSLGGSNRNYFSYNNALKIDFIREYIESNVIEEDNKIYLYACLVEASDLVANTAIVYGSFLSHMKKTALSDLILKPFKEESYNQDNMVYNQDSNTLIEEIKGDILYLDPPYNTRQYGFNYHLLNTIISNKNFYPTGKGGFGDYNRSKWSSVVYAEKQFNDLIDSAKCSFKYIFMSYNDEGIIPMSIIKSKLSSIGEYNLFKYNNYRRYSSNPNNTYDKKHTIEYLHSVKIK